MIKAFGKKRYLSMRQKHYAFGILMLIVCLGFCSGCAIPFRQAVVPLAPESSDSFAKNFQVINNCAIVIVYREDPRADDSLMGVLVDGKLVGKLAIKTYLRLELSPGMHEIISRTDNDSKINVNMIAGHIYFFRQLYRPGFRIALKTLRSKIESVPNQDGMREVKKCRLLLDVDRQANE